MKKKITSYKNSSDNYEIDIIDTIILLWNEKIKIIIITFFSFLIVSSYNYQLQTKFEISLPIKPSSDLELLRLEYIYLNVDNEEQGQINKIIFDKFIKKVMDYDELMLSEKNKYQVTLRLIWDNADEAKNILENTLMLALNNLEKSIFAELEKILLLKKKQIQIKDLEKIEFLLEQRSFAKEFDIVENKYASKLFKLDSLSNTNELLVPYYLRGYRVIDKEIDVLKNRKHPAFEFLKKEIAFLKESEINWVDYDINLLNTKQFKDGKLDLLISTLFGLFIAIFYVICERPLKIRSLKKN